MTLSPGHTVALLTLAVRFLRVLPFLEITISPIFPLSFPLGSKQLLLFQNEPCKFYVPPLFYSHQPERMADTPLLTAVINKDVGTVLALLDAAANDGSAVDLNVVDSEHGGTALMLAAGQGYIAVVAALLATTGKDGVAVDLNLTDKDGGDRAHLGCSRRPR